MRSYPVNLLAAWIGILLGFVSGLYLGLFFQRDNWLGGYSSFKRRLYRLGHIALFALGAVNLLFYFTAKELTPSAALGVASWGFVVGAALMPLCCVLTAHWPKARLLFAAPVLALVLAAILTVTGISGGLRGTLSQQGPGQPVVASGMISRP